MPAALQTTVTELGDSRVRLAVEVPPAEVEGRLERKAVQLGRDIKLYDDVAQIRATSVAGLKAKAGLIKNLDDDDHRAVAQSIIDDVLALGGVQS